MTHRGSWKRTERELALLLGGRRVPVTGRVRGDAPDIAHPYYSIEVKHKTFVPDWLLDAMRQAEASARGDQLPIAIIHKAGARYSDALVMMRLSDFIGWKGGSSWDGSQST